MRQAVLTEHIKKELVDRIMASEKVDKILLFGSEATGDSGPESDIDLFFNQNASFASIKDTVAFVEDKGKALLMNHTLPKHHFQSGQTDNLYIHLERMI